MVPLQILEPNNHFAQQLLDQVIDQRPAPRLVTTMSVEKKMNPFFRLGNQQIIKTLKAQLNDTKTDPESVFISLRSVRDKW